MAGKIAAWFKVSRIPLAAGLAVGAIVGAFLARIGDSLFDSLGGWLRWLAGSVGSAWAGSAFGVMAVAVAGGVSGIAIAFLISWLRARGRSRLVVFTYQGVQYRATATPNEIVQMDYPECPKCSEVLSESTIKDTPPHTWRCSSRICDFVTEQNFHATQPTPARRHAEGLLALGTLLHA
jgi:hypothetical protein